MKVAKAGRELAVPAWAARELMRLTEAVNGFK
jgi:hypothetical protein